MNPLFKVYSQMKSCLQISKKHLLMQCHTLFCCILKIHFIIYSCSHHLKTKCFWLSDLNGNSVYCINTLVKFKDFDDTNQRTFDVWHRATVEDKSLFNIWLFSHTHWQYFHSYVFSNDALNHPQQEQSEKKYFLQWLLQING